MTALANHRTTTVALVLLAFLAAFIAASVFGGGRSEANPFPGAVAQSASASASGVLVRAERATFSGMMVEIDLLIRPENDAAGRPAVIPNDVNLEGELAQSGHVRNDGRTSLRFPAAAWAPDAESLELTLAVLTLVQADGSRERVEGEWRLTIETPQGNAAEAARAVEVLPLATGDVAGQAFDVTTYRMPAMTVVRYELPADVLSFVPPALRAGDRIIEAAQAQQSGTVAEAWFETAQGDDALTLVFDELFVPAPDSRAWSVNIGLDTAAFSAPPIDRTGQTFQEVELAWTRQAGSDGPEIHSVTWTRLLDIVRLRVTLAGQWDPTMSGRPPAALGDGVPLVVESSGNQPATADRGPLTLVEVGLGDTTLPNSLSVRVEPGDIMPVPPVEVVLTP